MEEYKSGYPDQQGWYDVLIDGKTEDRLQHWVCHIAGRHHWKDKAGNYVEALHEVKWTGKPDIRP